MSEEIPRIEKRLLITSNKPGGYTQYSLTIPKEYGEKLKNQGTNSFYIIYNTVIIAFPANTVSAKDLLTFLQLRPKLEKLLRKQKEENQAK